jgi:hypothetical protein
MPDVGSLPNGELTSYVGKRRFIIRCDQPSALDLAARSGRKLENLPDGIIDEVLAKIAVIFD